jgi:hypothetical protein
MLHRNISVKFEFGDGTMIFDKPIPLLLYIGEKNRKFQFSSLTFEGMYVQG